MELPTLDFGGSVRPLRSNMFLASRCVTAREPWTGSPLERGGYEWRSLLLEIERRAHGERSRDGGRPVDSIQSPKSNIENRLA